MADEMETDLPVKVETDTDESEHENGCDETEKMEEDEEVNEEKDEDAATDSKDDALCSDPNYMELVNGQIKKRVAREFAKLINEGKLSLSDLDQRSRSFLANLKAEDGVQFARHLGQMITKRPQMEGADDKEEFIKRQLSILRVQLKKQNRDYLQEPVGGPDQEKIDELLQRTGYTMSIAGSQRIYGGPPPNWEGDQPLCENNLYISGLPRDMYEDELVPILEQCGRIWALRLMVSWLNNFSRGFCFLTYCTQEEAQRAVEKLNNLELRDGHTMKANLSNAHSTLFVKSLPNDKTDQQIRDEFGSKTEGFTDVRVMRCTSSPDVEGVPAAAFLSFSSQKHLAGAKRALVKGETKIFGARLDVSQADARGKPEDDCLNKVTEVHVHDMPASMHAEELRTKLGEYGEVKRVSKAGDHAIVFFVENEGAVKAMMALKGTWRQTSTLFYKSQFEDQSGATGASATAAANPYFCTVETMLGQEFGKIIIDISMGVHHQTPKQNEQQKTNKDTSRRGGGRGSRRPGRGGNGFFRGRGMERGSGGLLPLPIPPRQPTFRGPGGLMAPPPFGYRMGYGDRGAYVEDMDYEYDYHPRYAHDRFGLEDGFRHNERFRRLQLFDDYGDYGDYRSHMADGWRDRWGDFDLPSAVGPWNSGRGGWHERGSFPRGAGRGPNKRKSGGATVYRGKKQMKNTFK